MIPETPFSVSSTFLNVLTAESRSGDIFHKNVHKYIICDWTFLCINGGLSSTWQKNVAIFETMK